MSYQQYAGKFHGCLYVLSVGKEKVEQFISYTLQVSGLSYISLYRYVLSAVHEPVSCLSLYLLGRQVSCLSFYLLSSEEESKWFTPEFVWIFQVGTHLVFLSHGRGRANFFQYIER